MFNEELTPNLIDFLLTITDLTAIVGQRIAPGAIDQQDTYPFVIIKEIVSDDNQVLSGETSFVKVTADITSVGLSVEQAQSISVIIRKNLNGYQQKLMGQLYINSTRKTNEYTEENPPTTGNNKWVFERHTLYDISYPIPNNVN